MTWIISKALMKDYENSRSSQGRGEESSAGSCSDGAQSVPSSGTDMHGTFWSPGKTTDVLKPSRSGMTFKPLTDDLGEAVLMSCLEVFPVRTFHAPEKVQESKENEAPCGYTWQESSAKFDLATHSWKIAQCLWEEDLLESSVTLPKWGMMRSGVLWERTTPALLTSGTESGSWGTPRAGMGRSPACHYDRGRGNLEEQVGAAEYAKTWPTPTRNDAVGAGYQKSNGSHFFTLPGAVGATKHLPPEMEEKRQVKWPTPTAQDAKNNGAPSQMVRNTKPLNAEVGGQLNPTWVEWLMNWPTGWTDTDTNCKYETEYWKAASSTANQSDQLREMWWNRESGAPPQRPESDKQRSVQSRGAVFQVPPSGALEDQSREMQSVRNVIPTEADKTSETLRQFRMQQDSREDISRVAVGIKCRVDRLRCIGNGQVPAAAKLAWEVLSK
jgi:hypothetical protein